MLFWNNILALRIAKTKVLCTSNDDSIRASECFALFAVVKLLFVYRCEIRKTFYCSPVIVLKFKVRVFWDVAPYSHVELDRRFRGAYCLHYQGDEWNDALVSASQKEE
jgi:hypothetical protein